LTAVLTAAAQAGIHSLVALQDPSRPPTVRRSAARDILEMANCPSRPAPNRSLRGE